MADLVPNEGSAFLAEAPEQQTIDNSREKSEVMQVMPFLDKIVEWFDLQADETNRVTNIDRESKVSIEAQLQAYELLAELLVTKKGELQAFLETYQPRKK